MSLLDYISCVSVLRLEGIVRICWGRILEMLVTGKSSQVSELFTVHIIFVSNRLGFTILQIVPQ